MRACVRPSLRCCGAGAAISYFSQSRRGRPGARSERVLLGQPLELRFVNFDPKSANIVFKLLRYLLSVALVLAALSLLEQAFRGLAPDYSLPGYALQYVRYVAAGAINIFVAPLLFTRLGLAATKSEQKLRY